MIPIKGSESLILSKDSGLFVTGCCLPCHTGIVHDSSATSLPGNQERRHLDSLCARAGVSQRYAPKGESASSCVKSSRKPESDCHRSRTSEKQSAAASRVRVHRVMRSVSMMSIVVSNMGFDITPHGCTSHVSDVLMSRIRF